MADPAAEMAAYALKYTETARKSRKELPPDALIALFDVLDNLAANPNGYPGRTRILGADGRFRVYCHPSPAVEVTYEVDTEHGVLTLWHFVAKKVQVTKPVFISYSHKDVIWLEKLKMFLRPLEDKELIRVWDDTEIQPGSDWLQEIRTALESARVAVFLVTQNFLDSAFIQEKELPALLEAAQNRGCLIFWIAVSSTTFRDSPLARLQGANRPNEPLDLLSEPEQNKVLVEIYEKMKRAVVAD